MGAAATTALALWLAGCATPPATPSPAARGAITAEQAEAVERRWDTEWQAFTGLRAAVDLTIRARGRTDRTGAVLLLAPAALRLEVATPFGFPALAAVASPERILIVRPLERKALAARPTPEAVKRWLGVPLDPETLIRLLVGQVPHPDPGTLRVESTPSPHLSYTRGGVRHHVWLTVGSQPARLTIDGQAILVGFEWTATANLQAIQVDGPNQAQLSLRYISAEYASLPPEAFELLLPADFPVESLD